MHIEAFFPHFRHITCNYNFISLEAAAMADANAPMQTETDANAPPPRPPTPPPPDPALVAAAAKLLAAFGPPPSQGPPTEAAAAAREAAGAELLAMSLDGDPAREEAPGGAAAVAAAGGADVAGAVVRAEGSAPRGGSAELRRQAMALLANLCDRGEREAVLVSTKCLVAVSGAFCMDGAAEATHDAASVLCHAAKREVWGPMFDMPLVAERLGWILFELCCAMDGPEVKRTDAEDLLVKKCFELLWRLRFHRGSKIFANCCELVTRKCVLTAAISYIYDPRAQELRDVRHARDGPTRDARPSGLDCCLRALEGMSIYDATLNNAKGASRLSRAADAARALKATGDLRGNEKISCEIAIHTALQSEDASGFRNNAPKRPRAPPAPPSKRATRSSAAGDDDAAPPAGAPPPADNGVAAMLMDD